MKKTPDQRCGEWTVWHQTVRSTQSSVIQISHRNVYLSVFSILPKCLLLSLYMHISLTFHKVV